MHPPTSCVTQQLMTSWRHAAQVLQPCPHLKSLQLPALPHSRLLSSSRLSCTTMSPLQPPSSLQTVGCCECAAIFNTAVFSAGRTAGDNNVNSL